MASPPVQPPANPNPVIVWPNLPMSPLVQTRVDVVSVVRPANQHPAAALAVLAWVWAQERAERHAQVVKRTAVNPPLMFSMLWSPGIACLHDLALATANVPASNFILYEALHHVALPTEYQQLALFVQPGTSADGSALAVPRLLLERILECANSQVLSWVEQLDGRRRATHSELPQTGRGVLLCPRLEVEAGSAGRGIDWIMPIVHHHLELVEQPPRNVDLGVVPPSVGVWVPATDSTSAAPRRVDFPTLSASKLLTYELVRLRQHFDPRAPGFRGHVDAYGHQGHAAVCVFNIFLLVQIEQETFRAEAQQGPQVPDAVALARLSCRLSDFRRVARSYLAASSGRDSVGPFFEWLHHLGSIEWRSRLVTRSLTFLSGYWPSVEVVNWPETAPGQVPVRQPDANSRAGVLFARFNHVLSHVHSLAHPVDGPAGPSVYEPQRR
ncbi:hypothetical protein JCM3775_003403 [Rhodotorula graminis]|uniref:Uncharacterized protein n=1 Tax=Rhodotorula graminis (strain WP1) TaxID=578459 RepID=A0A0P9H170_RHOGW|nr:uncharacterized protein RHOBADRAFT_54873 [Rhodotorula graminis WP1]KPV73681.1 hypothetical protein RHOBADRAFT_54873 [Rhodotorula graminis WP1]